MNESQVSRERNRQSYCSGGFLQFSPLPIGIRIFLCIIVRGLPSFSIRRQNYNKPRWLFGPQQESSGYQLLAVKPASYQWVAEATYFPRRVLLERRNNAPSLEAASRISPCRLPTADWLRRSREVICHSQRCPSRFLDSPRQSVRKSSEDGLRAGACWRESNPAGPKRTNYRCLCCFHACKRQERNIAALTR